MKVNSAVSKAISILIVVVLVILVVASIAYYMIMQTPTSSSTAITTITSPATTTTTTTQTRTEMTTTAPTSGISPIVNLRVGSYAKYLQKTYIEKEIAESYITFRVEREEMYNNVHCVVLSMVIETQHEETTVKNVIMWWLSKPDLKTMHGKVQVYYNDVLVYEKELSPSEVTDETGQLPEPIDVRYFVGYETITVPADVFINCMKIEVSEEEYTVKTWVHPNVPIFGLVKSETYKAGSLMSLMELISYGG